jgi:hypothetical protein
LKFDYDEWPGAQTNDETIYRPYNDSIFQIRKFYSKVFPEDEFKSLEEQKENKDEVIDSTKVFKIKYSINILPSVGLYIVDNDKDNGGIKTFYNTDVNFMGLVNGTEELEIYSTDTMQQLISFKWDEYARSHHIVGCVMHMFYMIILIVYINVIYIKDAGTPA